MIHLVTATLGPGTSYLGSCYLGKSVLGRRRVYCLHYLVNSAPTLRSTHTPGTLDNPVDTVDTVTLTCTKATTETGTTTYKWYKDGVLDTNQADETWDIGPAKADGGSYACEVVVEDKGTSKKSAALQVDFLCEYHFYFILFILLLDVSFD